MNDRSLASVSGKNRVFLPVVHPTSVASALVATEVAVRAGADGIFLINQGLESEQVLDLTGEVSRRHPGLWVGVNLLGVAPARAHELVRGRPVRGLWVDSAADVALSESVRSEPARPLLFGGVAFKYQGHVPFADYGSHVQSAWARGVDVVTTSGDGTGEAARLDKVRAMREVVGDRPLALASGVTPDNIGDYLPLVDAFLVATGIESSFGVLDPDRTRRLADAIHAG